jgi:hypothetical protein
MAIEWDYLIVEMVLLAGIIWFTVYIEHLAYRISQKIQIKMSSIFQKLKR